MRGPCTVHRQTGKACSTYTCEISVAGTTFDADRTEEGLTAGLGLDLGMGGYDATVNYAFTSFGILDSVHQFSLQFQF